MGDLAASDVTVTLGQGDIDQTAMGNKMVFPTLTFGDTSSTYPAGGIPLPAIGYFDLYFGIKYSPPTVSGGYTYQVDITNHTLLIYIGNDGGAMDEFSGAPAATTIRLMLVGQ